jgi:hypothetical protein
VEGSIFFFVKMRLSRSTDAKTAVSGREAAVKKYAIFT